MNQNEMALALLPDVKRMTCGILGLSPDHTGPLVYYSDAALAIKAALTSRDPAYDRELIARMLTEYNAGLIGQFSPVAVEHQIKLLREAENLDAEGVRTVRRGGHIDDTAMLDWLSDPNNTIGNVQLPTACVMNNMDSLRGAIREAMRLRTNGDMSKNPENLDTSGERVHGIDAAGVE